MNAVVSTAPSCGVHASDSVAEVLSMLHPYGTKDGAMAILRAYLDESADGKKERVFAIGGFVGQDQAWLNFEIDWQQATGFLKEPFHMTDFENRREEYEHWDSDFRLEFIKKVVRIVTQGDIVAFGAAVLIDDFYEVFPDESMEYMEYLCLAHCVSHMAEWAAMGENKIAFMFDQNHDFELRAPKMFKRMREDVNFPWRDRLRTLAFGSRKQYNPLCITDLAAYEIFKCTHNKRHRTELPIRRTLDRMVASGRFNFFRWTKPYLQDLSTRLSEAKQAGEEYSILRYLSVDVKANWQARVQASQQGASGS